MADKSGNKTKDIIMEIEKIFKTKSGYCHVLPDKIVLTRNGLIGSIAKMTMGNNIARPLIIYGIISVWIFFLVAKMFAEGENVSASLFLIFGLLLVFGFFKNLHNSATPVIDRDKIKNIEFKKAISGVIRAYFIIRFETDTGKIKQRIIMLPGSLSNGPKETEKALEIMTTEFRQIKNVS